MAKGFTVKAFLVLLSLLFSITLFGDDGISDLKSGCTDPGRWHNQIPPTDIKITCKDERIEWVQTTDGSGTFHNSRKMCTTAITTKPNIKAPKVCTPCGWPDSPFKCTGFKETCSTVALTYSVTCEQILSMKDILTFCLNAVDKEVALNETILDVKETGKVKMICGVDNFINGKPADENWNVTTTTMGQK